MRELGALDFAQAIKHVYLNPGGCDDEQIMAHLVFLFKHREDLESHAELWDFFKSHLPLRQAAVGAAVVSVERIYCHPTDLFLPPPSSPSICYSLRLAGLHVVHDAVIGALASATCNVGTGNVCLAEEFLKSWLGVGTLGHDQALHWLTKLHQQPLSQLLLWLSDEHIMEHATFAFQNLQGLRSEKSLAFDYWGKQLKRHLLLRVLTSGLDAAGHRVYCTGPNLYHPDGHGGPSSPEGFKWALVDLLPKNEVQFLHDG